MLLFNLLPRPNCLYFHFISIHLMLLFNDIAALSDTISFHFNTSNVTIQRPATIPTSFILLHFNTSNVTIQLLNTIRLHSSFLISIHLMLLFNILIRLLLFRVVYNFNTSNVTIQLFILGCLLIKDFHFNTSNVTIQREMQEACYLLCYISIHLMLLFNYM